LPTAVVNLEKVNLLGDADVIVGYLLQELRWKIPRAINSELAASISRTIPNQSRKHG